MSTLTRRASAETTRRHRTRGSGRVSGHRGSLQVPWIVLPQLLALLAVCLYPLGDWKDLGGRAAPMLLLAALTAVLTMTYGAITTRRQYGHLDPFAPTVAPVAYVGFSFLAPAWRMLVQGKTLLGFSPYSFAQETPRLVALAALSFFIGTSLFFSRSSRSNGGPSAHRLWHPSLNLTVAGYCLLAASFALAMYSLTQGGVTTRGLDQTSYSAGKALDSLARMAAPAAVLMLMFGKAGSPVGPKLTRTDLLLISLLVALLGLGGNRGAAVGIFFALGYGYTRNRSRVRAIVLGSACIAFFSVAVSAYRQTANGRAATLTGLDSILTDLSVVTYTVGATAAAIPTTQPLLMGATFGEAVLRQLPSPIAVRLFGPPMDTGSSIFRRLIGLNNPNFGVGYSLPAEGYLNFGTVGLVLTSFVLGFGLAVSYAIARRSETVARTMTFIYPLALVAMPPSLRADSLGGIKAILYPVLMVGLALAFTVRVVRRKRQPITPASPGQTDCPQSDSDEGIGAQLRSGKARKGRRPTRDFARYGNRRGSRR